MIKKDALVNLLLGLTIALLPFYNRFTMLDFNRTSKDNLLVLICLFLMWVLGREKVKRRLSIKMLITLIYGLFLLVVNQWNVLSLNVMFQVFYISTGMMFFASFYEKFCEETLHYVLYGMVAGASLQSVIVISQFLKFDFYQKFLSYLFDLNFVGGSSLSGTFYNPNLLGAYLVLCIPAFLKCKNKFFIILPIIGLLISKSMISIFAFVGAVFYFYKIISKVKMYCLSICAMFLFYFFGMAGHDSGRIEIWNKSFAKIDLWHFLIGKGAGWFADQKIFYREVQVIQEHNNFLTFFNIFGIIGMLLTTPIFLKFLFTKDKNAIFSTILFTAFLNSFGHFSLHQSTTSIIIVTTLAVCIAEKDRDGTGMDRISDSDKTFTKVWLH